MADSKQVIVLGAGLAGMATSLALARTGMSPILLEAGATVGGCCSTVNHDGFTFNNGAVYVAAPSLLRLAFDRLGEDFDKEVTLTEIARPQATYLDDGTVVRLSSADASFVEGERASERTLLLQQGLAELQRRWAPVYRALVHEVLPFEPSLLRTLARLWRYLPRMAGPADRLIADCFRDPSLQAAVSSTLLYTGMPPEQIPVTQIIGLVALLEEGLHLPRGGMGAISEALHRALLRQAARVRFGERVERIEVRDGSVQGVTLTGGERIESKCVVAACSGFEVVHHLLPVNAVPRALRLRARKAPLSHRAISIQVGCSGCELPGAFIVNHVPPMPEQGGMHVFRPGTPRWLA
jgi:phytoene desaturase